MSLTKESDQYKYEGIARLVDEERQSEATSTIRLVSSDYEGLQILKSIEVGSQGNVVEVVAGRKAIELPWWSKFL
jgi:hypothetical protein